MTVSAVSARKQLQTLLSSSGQDESHGHPPKTTDTVAERSGRKRKRAKAPAEQLAGRPETESRSGAVVTPASSSGSDDEPEDELLSTESSGESVEPSGDVILSTIDRDGAIRETAQGQVVYVTLRRNQSVTVLGEFEFRVTRGVLLFMGAVLRKNEEFQTAFVPSTHSLPPFRCVAEEPAEHGAEIELRHCSSGIRNLEQVSPKMGRIWSGNERSFEIMTKSSDDRLRRQFSTLDIAPLWSATISTLQQHSQKRCSRTLVAGPKGSGKSTFCRHLVNQILTRDGESREVALLDLDPGQPEFSPSGQVSLTILRKPILGPPYTHPGHDTAKAHSIGSNSPKDEPLHYLACAIDLLQSFTETFKGTVPLVANCSGWVLGMGLEILRRLILPFQPTDLVFTADTGLIDVFDTLNKVMPSGCTLHKIPSQASENRSRTSAELRAMQTLSYFHQTVLKCSWDATPISKLPNQKIYYAGPKAGFTGITLLGDRLPVHHLRTVLDASLVSVVAIKTTHKLFVNRSPEDLPLLLSGSSMNPVSSRLLGLAYVRSIDAENKTLDLISPIPLTAPNAESELVLVLGHLDTPAWAYLEEESRRTHAKRHDGRVKSEWDNLRAMLDKREIPYIETQRAGKVRRARRNLLVRDGTR